MGVPDSGGPLSHGSRFVIRQDRNQVTTKAPTEKVVKDIRRTTRKQNSAEEKIRIVHVRSDD